jgi:hypothetical protein
MELQYKDGFDLATKRKMPMMKTKIKMGTTCKWKEEHGRKMRRSFGKTEIERFLWKMKKEKKQKYFKFLFLLI